MILYRGIYFLHTTPGVSGDFAKIMERLRFDYLGKIVQSTPWLSGREAAG